MSKIQGRGGYLKKDTVVQASIKSFAFDEVEGDIYGQKQSNISIETYADSTTIPYRHGDEFDVELGHSGVSWTIDAGQCRVDSSSIKFVGGEAVSQSISLIGRTKAVIA